MSATKLTAQLEPPQLLDAFIHAPPMDFAAQLWLGGTPVFAAPFDLLTTADDAVRRRVARLPGYRHWRRCITWRTRFVGSTVTEYAVLPPSVSPEHWTDQLLAEWGSDCRLLIVKDLAHASPLLSAEDNERVAAFTRALQARHFVLLEGQALAWVPVDFDSEDAYLARLSYSRRKDIRRKLRKRSALDIEQVATGDPRFADAALLAQMYALYQGVYAQSEIHFDQLTPAFFRRVLQTADTGGVVFMYRAQGQLIGWNLCYEWGGKLIDKYIGLAYPQARQYNLYFVSWMVNLEHARERGLSHYVAGWTDPQVKASLGARFTMTRHAVYTRSRWLRPVLRRLAHHFESDRQWQERNQQEDRPHD